MYVYLLCLGARCDPFAPSVAPVKLAKKKLCLLSVGAKHCRLLHLQQSPIDTRTLGDPYSYTRRSAGCGEPWDKLISQALTRCKGACPSAAEDLARLLTLLAPTPLAQAWRLSRAHAVPEASSEPHAGLCT